MMTRSHWLITASASILALGLGAAPAGAASQIGVAAAVNPQAVGQPTGGAQRTIVIGNKLTFRERVRTTEGGLVQVLLIDGSTFTVGPNSDLVIDEFVYNPSTGSGKLVATFSKGVMRFVGGKLSKNEDGVKIKTPVGLMGIRGGVANVSVDPAADSFFSLLYGQQLTLLGPDGDLQTVYERGYGIDVTGGISGPMSIRQVTEAEAQMFVSQLSGAAGTSGGATQQPTNQNVQQSGVSSQGSDNDPDEVAPGSRPDAVLSEDAPLFTNVLSANTIIARKDMRVLSTGTQYSVADGAGFTVISPSGTGIVGATIGQDPAVADQQANFAVNALLSATGSLTNGSMTIPFPILKGTYIISGATSPFGSLSGTVMVGANADFLFYRLFANGNINQPVYVIGGTPTHEAKLFGTGDIQRYKLGEDIVQQITMPFVTTASAGANTDNAFVSDLFFVRPDGERFDDDTNALVAGTPATLQASLNIDGSGSSQTSALVLAVGNTADEVVRLGGARTDATLRAISFSGEFDFVEGANGTQIFGSNGDYFVAGANATEGEVFVDIDDASTQTRSATTHVATFDSQSQLNTLSRTNATINGFAAGMVELVGNAAKPLPYRSTMSGDLTIALNATNNTIGGRVIVRDVADADPVLASIQTAFGDGIGANVGNNGPSAMVDDDIFAAGPNPINTETILTEQDASPTSVANVSSDTGTFLVSSAAVGNVMPQGRTQQCTCEYLKWGYWGTRPNFDQAGDPAGNTPVNPNVYAGTWAAGVVAREVNTVEIPIGGNAVYTGDALGDVTRDVGGLGTNIQQYKASGDFSLTWDFGTRTGTTAISNFDGMNITDNGGLTAVNAPNSTLPAEFSGNLTDSAGMTGSINGAFVGPESGFAPHGVIGAFDLAGTNGLDAVTVSGTVFGERP